MIGGVSSGPVYLAASLQGLAFKGSARRVQMTTEWIVRGSNEPSAF
jgi:hypothetical protein